MRSGNKVESCQAQLFAGCLRDQEVVIVNARASVVGELPELPREPVLRGAKRNRNGVQPRLSRQAFLGRWLEIPVFDLESLSPGNTLKGPAIVETTTTTVLLRPEDHATITPLGWLDISVGSAKS